MPSVNEQVRDAEIGHQVDLSRYSNGQVLRFMALLNRVDSDLFAQITRVLDTLDGTANVASERLDSLLQSVRLINAQAYQAAGHALRLELRHLTDYEAGFQLQLFRSELPTLVKIAETNPEQVYAAAMARPFQGRLLSEWANSIEADRMTRIRDAIRIGFVENQTVSQIVQRLRGTKTNGYADGLLEIDRRNAEAVVRTAVSHTAAFTRDRFYQANGDIIKAVVWTATLDTRTSLICRERDGLEYTNDTHRPIGHLLPWLGGPGAAHWNCRSSSVAVTKSFRELGINMDELPPGSRASMDGQVPAETTYAQWLTKQSAARQDEVLGPTRGKLLRNGGFTVDRFTNDKGRQYTLEQLRGMDAKAFTRAGV